MNIIELDQVSVVFQQRKDRMLLRDHLKEAARRGPQEGFYALHEVSFQVRAGEGVAIFGANGAGKSTMLSLLAGLILPHAGQVRVEGQVGAILELGSGFHPELSGRENLILNAALIGLKEEKARAATQAIIDFSELGEFIDQPLRTYSNGMSLRLGFAVAIHGEFDLLLVDEVLAVGDYAFQQKCLSHVEGLRKQGKTLVIVTHAPQSLERFCDRAIWLHHGHVIRDGTFQEVTREYEEFISDPARRLSDDLPAQPVRLNPQNRRGGFN